MPEYKAKHEKKLQVLQCKSHNCWALAIGNDDSGIRLTGLKCCGSWSVIKEFSITERVCDDAIKELQAIRRRLKRGKPHEA